MKRILLLISTLVLVTSCSFKLTDTVWCNSMPGELEGKKADVINSVYFLRDGYITFNTCVKNDSTIILPQTETAIGTYKSKGNLKKGIQLEIETSDSYGVVNHKKGLVNKHGLFISETDTTAVVYFLVSNIKLK